MRDKSGLTFKELSFADNYINFAGNVLQAYQASLYSQNCTELTKRNNGYKLLNKQHVRDYIQQKLDEKKDKDSIRAEITRDEVIANARWLIDYGKENNRYTAVSAGNDQLGKIAGVFSESLNVNDLQKQRILDKIEAQEADMIADIRLRQIINAGPQLLQIANTTPVTPLDTITDTGCASQDCVGCDNSGQADTNIPLNQNQPCDNND